MNLRFSVLLALALPLVAATHPDLQGNWTNASLTPGTPRQPDRQNGSQPRPKLLPGSNKEKSRTTATAATAIPKPTLPALTTNFSTIRARTYPSSTAPSGRR